MYFADKCTCYNNEHILNDISFWINLNPNYAYSELLIFEIYLIFHGNVKLPINSLYANIQTPFGNFKNIYFNESYTSNHFHRYFARLVIDKNKINFGNQICFKKLIPFVVSVNVNINVLNSSGFTMEKHHNEQCVKEFLQICNTTNFQYTNLFNLDTNNGTSDLDLNWRGIYVNKKTNLNFDSWDYIKEIYNLKAINNCDISNLYIKINYKFKNQNKTFVIKKPNCKNIVTSNYLLDWNFEKDELFLNPKTNIKGIFFPYKTIGNIELFFILNKSIYYGTKPFSIKENLISYYNDAPSVYQISILENNKELTDNEI